MPHAVAEPMAVMNDTPLAAALPDAVQAKLAQCGEALSPEQWMALPPAARTRLVQVPAGTPVERAAYRSLVRWLVRTFPASMA